MGGAHRKTVIADPQPGRVVGWREHRDMVRRTVAGSRTHGLTVRARASTAGPYVASRFVGDGEVDDDNGTTGRLLPPEDRLWRHPSEFSGSAAALRFPNRGTILFSAVGGALLVGALWLTIGGPTKVTVATERVALIPVESVAPRVTPADEWSRAVTEVARPSTAAVRLIGSSTIIAGAVAIRDDGYMITSRRALGGAEKVMIVTPTGRASEATVIGDDPVTDLSVLKTDDRMAAAVVSDSGGPAAGASLAVVDPAGNPQSRLVIQRAGTSATSDGDLLVGVIALDGTIGSVLPGSPAVDATGAVVGMVVSTAKNAPAAIMPIGLARSMVHDLIATGRMTHPKAGITARDVLSTDNLGPTAGALVTSVEPNGPAADGGILVGDVVVKVAGTDITTMAEMVAELMLHKPGERIDFLVVRNGTEVMRQVVLHASVPAD